VAVIRAFLWPLEGLQAARGQLFPWVAVLIGCGVWLWFEWPQEPGRGGYLLAGLVLALGAGLGLKGPELARPLAIAAAALALGWLAAGARAHHVAGPMLEFRYYGPVEGRVVRIDRSQSDAPRITLDRVVLSDMAPARTPRRVRVTLHGDQPWHQPEPGQVVMTTAHLSAPDGPVEPGGFDFRRMAYFERLGAVGYTRVPLLLLEEAEGTALPVDRMRRYLSGAIRAQIDGQPGAFAAATMTGDRSAIDEATATALRDTSLAHILAISGMHMVFLTGFVFALVRYGLALVPFVALRIDTRKVAAVVGLAVALFYMLLSGSAVSTQRAFIMISVFLGAVLLDRRALTLRSVTIAAIVILTFWPESLLSPGFQMSFAATIALIVSFNGVSQRIYRQQVPRWAMPVFTLFLSCLVGGFSTAPYAAAHFNRFADYGLLANMLTVPVFGSVMMPAGAVAALLGPLGLAWLPLWVMEQGARWVLFVAHWVAGLEGAVSAVPAPGPWPLPLFTLGAIWLILWRGRVRWAGLAPVALSAVLWAGAERPALLISSDGRLLGLMGPEGRALSAARGGGFAAETWLENDGDLVAQDVAAARSGFTGMKGERWFQIGGLTGVALSGKGAADKLEAVCSTGALVILAERARDVPEGCRLIDQRVLEATGALAIRAEGDALVFTATRDRARLWSPPMRAVTLPDLIPAPVVLAGQ
jgi:competence protein ComEC